MIECLDILWPREVDNIRLIIEFSIKIKQECELGVVLHTRGVGIGKKGLKEEREKRENRRKRVKGGKRKERILLFMMVSL